jgi:pimeloyl-ACP methyl ester carboxylesterase
VIAIDPRSQGPSIKTTEGNIPETRAKDLHEVLANLGVSRAVLVGWSQGAQDVASYIQQFGTKSLAGAIFVDSPVSIGPAEIERHKEEIVSHRAGVGPRQAELRGARKEYGAVDLPGQRLRLKQCEFDSV